MQNMGPNLFVCNENIACIMPRVTAHAHAGKPATLIIHGMPGITHVHAVHAGRMIFIKNNCHTF